MPPVADPFRMHSVEFALEGRDPCRTHLPSQERIADPRRALRADRSREDLGRGEISPFAEPKLDCVTVAVDGAPTLSRRIHKRAERLLIGARI